MTKTELLNGTSLSFIGDAVYSLYVREHCLTLGLRRAEDLQRKTVAYVSAKGQCDAYNKLIEADFFTENELNIFKRGRNAIGHIPKNGNLHDYSVASGLEAICGYLYLTDKSRLDDLFELIL